MKHQHSVLRLTVTASARRAGVHRLEGHVVIVQEAIERFQLPLTPHRFGKAQVGVARELQSMSSSLIKEL